MAPREGPMAAALDESIVKDGLIDLREKIGEPGHPKGIDRLPDVAQRNLAGVRARHAAESERQSGWGPERLLPDPRHRREAA
jgi:hypothetical protein